MFVIEVLTKRYHVVAGDTEDWVPFRGASGKPHAWSTRKEAEAMADLCFPRAEAQRIRISEVTQ